MILQSGILSLCVLMHQLSGGGCLPTGDMPDGWETTCVRNVSLVDWNPTHPSFNWSQPVVQISCQLTTEQLEFADFRSWSNTTDGRPIALKVHCVDGGNSTFSLPWPMKAPHLVSLEVAGCLLKDYYSEYLYDSTDIEQHLRIIILEDVAPEFPTTFLYDLVSDVSRVSQDVHCLSLVLEKYVFRNVSIRFVIDKMQHMQNLTFVMSEWLKLEQNIPHKCDYKFFQYMEESNNGAGGSAKHFFNQQYRSSFPELRVYNLTQMSYEIIPNEMTDWRFEYPRLEYLDFRRNRLEDFYFRDYGINDDSVGVIDLRHNNISQLTADNLETLKLLKTAVVNLRDNPLSCDCYVNDYLFKFLRDNPRLEDAYAGLGRYEYLRNLSCASPKRLAGIPFGQVSQDDILCQEEAPVTFIVTVTFLSLLFILFVVACLLTFRYRKEMTILLYTRCGILFRKLGGEIKKFDAFISYSTLDSSWVISTLVKRLESGEKGPAFKLCVHHRDFEVGAAIADNVVSSVESSRHTVLVMSRNFTKSEWCIYEFRTAMHQSLIEKRRHMIIILMEPVPKGELEPDLRKCLETFTYISVGDRLFWDKLIYSLSCGAGKIQKKTSSKRSVSQSKPA